MKAMSEPKHEFVVSRVFDAPRDLVWRAYTEPERLAHWWGPKGFTVETANVDLRQGGSFHYGLATAAGQEMWGKWVYLEIAEPERLAVIATFSDPQGAVVRNPWNPEWPLEMRCVMTFAEREGKTEVTIATTPHNASEAECAAFGAGREGMIQGFGATFDQLEEYLGVASREIVVAHTYDAPREVVFRAWTDPSQIGQWWGPDGFTTTIHEMDVRPGGQWRFVMHGPDGTDYNNWVRYEVVDSDRLLYEHGAEIDEPAHFHVTATFDERDGKTRVALRSLFPTREAHDAVIAFGAIELGRQTLAKLANHLAAR